MMGSLRHGKSSTYDGFIAQREQIGKQRGSIRFWLTDEVIGQ
jgi:hypothetical protein